MYNCITNCLNPFDVASNSDYGRLQTIFHLVEGDTLSVFIIFILCFNQIALQGRKLSCEIPKDLASNVNHMFIPIMLR